ncbi:hypothetical protein BJ508DRAFT_156332 [Ascobolus immersus RN42]|uniref:Uncharacterized protein n=1 Tax=Ascobolus immersus RN42 TaxID=1160509 RepID=A0A3N4HX14_ASCIM|nr:hypothetical protein BJ508DRAFT_156332 [Ascobolus immersus RN42]
MTVQRRKCEALGTVLALHKPPTCGNIHPAYQNQFNPSSTLVTMASSTFPTGPSPFPFLDLPPDIRLHIYTNCSAFTLLQLAQTSRPLRRELTTNTSLLASSPGYTPSSSTSLSPLTIHNITLIPTPPERDLFYRLHVLEGRACLDAYRIIQLDKGPDVEPTWELNVMDKQGRMVPLEGRRVCCDVCTRVVGVRKWVRRYPNGGEYGRGLVMGIWRGECRCGKGARVTWSRPAV